MATAAAQVIEEEEARHIHSTHLTEDDHAKNDIDNTRHKLSKRAPVFPFDPFVGPKFAKKAIKFGPKLALKKTVKLPKKALKKTSPFLLKKSVKTLPLLGAPLLGPLAVKAVIKGPKEAIKLGGGPLAISALGGNFDQENIRLTLLRFRNGLPTVGNPLDMS